jgi:hypothetical protein
MEGQLADEDNQIAEKARRTAKVIAKGETAFVPVVIRAIRELLCGLPQRESGVAVRNGREVVLKIRERRNHPLGGRQSDC